MDLINAISILGTVATATDIGTKIHSWLSDKQRGASSQEIEQILKSLPASASAEQVISAITPIFLKENDVMLKAGSNHGGDLHIHNSIVEAGIGGKVIVSGGDGGEHGKGGDVHISSTTFKGGGNN